MHQKWEAMLQDGDLTVGASRNRGERETDKAVPTQVTTFHVNQTFAPMNTSEFFSADTLQAWNELMPS